MSVINQVLSDLEKRGTARLPSEPAIRPVVVRARPHKLLLPTVAVLLALGAAALGPRLRHGQVPPVAAAAPEAAHADGERRMGAPASRLSFELSAVPPPAGAHAQAAAVAPPVAPSADEMPAARPASSIAPTGSVNKQIRQATSRQLADYEFHKGDSLMRQGRNAEAIAAYEAALRLDAGHDAARQALAGLLLDGKRNADAERLLQEGLNLNPRHSGFAMLLARLQVERGALPEALEALQTTLPYAGQQADYLAFVAAVQQRLGQHQEAVAHYQAALQLSPDSGLWLMGEGISLQALQRNDAARDAFQHALNSHSLSAELQAFVRQRLKQLS